MRPLPFVFPYWIVFWTVYVWVFWPEMAIIRRSKRTGNATDSRSLQTIVTGMWIAYLGAFPLAFVPALQFSIANQVPVFWIGMVVFVSGSLLRRHCWRLLGESFTGDVRARPDQKVITRGAYTLLRHPSYTGGILINTGVGIALGSWASALLLAVVSFAVYAYRIVVEERALAATIGAPYREFMRTRKRLIPFIY